MGYPFYKKSADVDYHSGLFLLIHITGKVFHTGLSLLVLERISLYWLLGLSVLEE